MSLRLIERAWDPDSPSNADWFCTLEHTALLLDGAASRAQERVSAAANDTVWLVRRFVEAFASAEAVDVRTRVDQARALLSREYGALCAGAGFTPPESPFASRSPSTSRAVSSSSTWAI